MTEPQTQASLKAETRRIYEEANRYADGHGDVGHGMNILYGPPILNPRVMIVSAQGGGADRNRQRTWPANLEYSASGYEFGRRLARDFKKAGLRDVLENHTVGTNIAFPQAPGFDDWLRKPGSEVWLEKSLAWVEELVKLMPPRVILTYGATPYVTLLGTGKSIALNWRNGGAFRLSGVGISCRGRPKRSGWRRSGLLGKKWGCLRRASRKVRDQSGCTARPGNAPTRCTRRASQDPARKLKSKHN